MPPVVKKKMNGNFTGIENTSVDFNTLNYLQENYQYI